MEVYAYTADLAQPDEANPADIPPIALDARRVAGAPDRLPRRRSCARASPRSSAARSTSRVGGKKYFNTTPLGRAVTTTAIVRAMVDDDVHVFGDGSTHKGNDIQRFYRYGILVDPTLQDLQAVARRRVRQGVRRPQGDGAVPREDRQAVQDGRREGVLAPTRTCSAPRTRRRTSSASTSAMRIVEPIMGVAHWKPEVAIAPEEVTVGFEQGHAGDDQRQALRLAVRAVPRGATGSAAATAWA